MTRALEFMGFIGLAASVHVGLFVQFGPQGAQSEGSAGQASVSLVAGSQEMTERVAEWSRPVEAMQQVSVTSPAPDAPEAPTMAAPTPPRAPDKPKAPEARPTPAPAPSETLPQVDTRTAQPSLLEHAPETSQRPQTRPTRPAEPKATPKKRKAKPAASPARSQDARGGQTGRHAGDTAKKQTASSSQAARRSLMARWGASIRNQVERRKRYPAGTDANGKTVLRLTISRDGRLSGVSLISSSGSKTLDKAAIRAAQRARYPAAPKGLSAAQYSFNLPVSFKRN